MILVKYTILILIFIISTFIGLAISSKYKNRVKDLKLMRNILNILETKIKYTYDPLPQIFSEISKEFKGNVGDIFKIAQEKMSELPAGKAWHYAIENSYTSMNKEDLNLLKNFEKLLR